MTANCEKCGKKYDGITHWKKGDVLICPSCMPNNQQKEEVKCKCHCCKGWYYGNFPKCKCPERACEDDCIGCKPQKRYAKVCKNVGEKGFSEPQKEVKHTCNVSATNPNIKTANFCYACTNGVEPESMVTTLEEDRKLLKQYPAVTSDLLAGMLICNRDWQAWELGTMTEDDFFDASEDDDSVGQIDTFIEKLLAAQARVVRAECAEIVDKIEKRIEGDRTVQLGFILSEIDEAKSKILNNDKNHEECPGCGADEGQVCPYNCPENS